MWIWIVNSTLVSNNKGDTKTVLNFINELFDVDKEVLEKVSTESKKPLHREDNEMRSMNMNICGHIIRHWGL